MKKYLYCFTIVLTILIIASCAFTRSKPASYYLTDSYYKEVMDQEKGEVVDKYYSVLKHLSKREFKEAAKAASDGINNIPRYKSVFTYFYAMRGYSYIMLYNLDKGMDDIKNLENLDKKTLFIPCLYTYYYMSYASFNSDPDFYFLKALEYLKVWRETKPKNYFETFLYDAKRISEIEKTIKEGMSK